MSKKCCEIHKIMNCMRRFEYPFNDEILPESGVYILFEEGEYAHFGDRIVRIGTHTGDKALKERLLNHFIKGYKDRNIFRKNIGRAILNRDSNNYLDKWNLNLRSKENREKYLHLIDTEFEKELEGIISTYIQSHISFVLIEEIDKEKRLFWERKLISEISNCKDCTASENWLGNYSPKDKIAQSGLWQVNELYKEGFSDLEFDCFIQKVLNTKIKYGY